MRMDLARNTRFLREARDGDETCSVELSEIVYGKLHDLAARYMRKERKGHTLQATALVHEAYLLLIDREGVEQRDHDHFVSIAACAMRRVLIDHARARGARKRGGDARRVPLQDDLALCPGPDLDLLSLDEALSRLQRADERRGRVVELRFFGGLTCKEAARVLGVSLKTVEDDWHVARTWLYRELTRDTRE
ncbi:MAG: ECF-type sigma factor [Planctomycetota bacterium]|nr:ECF-type sigma factor [Planctomycetota bacterium]